MNSSQVGFQSEIFAIAELAKRGYRIYLPTGPAGRVDFIAEQDGVVYRLQCKTGRVIDDGVYVRYTAFGNRQKDYVDAFIIYCSELQTLYWIPIDKVEPFGKWGKLRLVPTEIKRIKGTAKLAKDYQI